MSPDSERKGTAIVIPVFNEVSSIASVVKAVSPFGTAIVIDDGSTDGSGALAAASGAIVVFHHENRGYDAALNTGLKKAIASKFDFAITLDGDGQHDPKMIIRFVDQLLNGADLVIGIRQKYQRLCEGVFAALTSVIWGIADPLCGMKGYRISKLMELDTISTYKSIGTELVIRAARSSWRITQVPISTNNRKGQSRFGDGLYPNYLIAKAMFIGLLLTRSSCEDAISKLTNKS